MAYGALHSMAAWSDVHFLIEYYTFLLWSALRLLTIPFHTQHVPQVTNSNPLDNIITLDEAWLVYITVKVNYCDMQLDNRTLKLYRYKWKLKLQAKIAFIKREYNTVGAKRNQHFSLFLSKMSSYEIWFFYQSQYNEKRHFFAGNSTFYLFLLFLLL